MLNHDFDHTRMVCRECRTAHPAVAVEADGRSWWDIDCPRGRRRVPMSSDPELFGYFRASCPAIPADTKRHYSNIILHINDNCSLQCPICFASAETGGWRIDLADLRRRAAVIARYRPAVVMLSGGEPTEHPELIAIVRILAREFRFKVSMLTNGVRLGNDPGFAAELKRAGLRKASVSLDSFDPETTGYMRGGGQELIDLKLRALRHCREAGLNSGIVTTLCTRNLGELGALLRFVLNHAGAMTVFDIQCLQPGGRYPDKIESADREQAIHALVDSGVVPGLEPHDFMETPQIPAFGFCIHPDCGSGVFLVVRDGAGRVLDRELPFRKLVRAMARSTWWSRRFPKSWLALQVLRHIGCSGFALRRAWLWGTRRPKEAVVLVAITTLMMPDKLDCERVKRCANAILLADGSLRPCCFYYAYQYKPERHDSR